MVKSLGRLKANGARREVFAGQSLNGNGKHGTDPPEMEKRPAKGANPEHVAAEAIQQSEAYDGNGQGQAQSRNGSKPPIRDGIYQSKQTFDLILKVGGRRAGDMLALWTFYHQTALWQRTNQPRASVRYVSKGLGWGAEKVCEIKALLRQAKLIEDLRVTDPRTHRVKGWFVRLRFFKPVNESSLHFEGQNPHSGFPESGFPDQNAFRSDNQNAFRSDNQFKTSLNAVHRQAAHRNSSFVRPDRRRRKGKQDVERELSHYTPHEREQIEHWHRIVCDNDRSFRRVDEYRGSVCTVIDVFFNEYGVVDEASKDMETWCHAVLAASRCGCGNDECETCGAVRIPRRGHSRTLVNTAWKEYGEPTEDEP